MMHSQMAIYIDERTMVDMAKIDEEFEAEFSDGEDDSDLERPMADPFIVEPKGKKKKDTMKSVSVKERVRLSTVDNFQVTYSVFLRLNTNIFSGRRGRSNHYFDC